MSIEGIKPIASLGAGLLGRRAPARRVPLSFAPLEEIAAEIAVDTHAGAEVPEVVLQWSRLEQAMGNEGAAEPACADRPRVAFTLRLDPARHGRLRRMSVAQRRSAQQLLIEAFDRYSTGASGAAAYPANSTVATIPSSRKAPTGTQS